MFFALVLFSTAKRINFRRVHRFVSWAISPGASVSLRLAVPTFHLRRPDEVQANVYHRYFRLQQAYQAFLNVFLFPWEINFPHPRNPTLGLQCPPTVSVRIVWCRDFVMSDIKPSLYSIGFPNSDLRLHMEL